MRLASLTLILTIVLSSCGSKLLTDTPENTSLSVYNVIVENNPEGLKKLLFTTDELKVWLSENEQGDVEAQMVDIMDMYDHLDRIVNLVRTVGEKAGINWTATEVVHNTVDTDGDSDRAVTMVALTFASNGGEYQIISNMALSANGWRLTAPPLASWIETE